MMNSQMIKFYDTCSLLSLGELLFTKKEHFIISSITLQELENIKNSSTKDADIKYSARLVSQLLEQYSDLYTVVIHYPRHEILVTDLKITNDIKILSDAIYYNNNHQQIIFVTNDLCLKNIALLYFDEDCVINTIAEEGDYYTGYKEIILSDEELANLYSSPTDNFYNLNIGEYIIVRDKDYKILDIRVWTGTDHRRLKYNSFNSKWLGKIDPYNQDPYQKLLFDSLTNNKITMVKGLPGSGKTITSLAFLLSKLEKGDIDHIIVFCNPVATVNSAKLGFYPGTRDEKLLDSQIGNLLISKIGGREEVERLMYQQKLILLPLSDIRGYDTSGMRAGIYISEAQNLDRTLMKLALQRIGEDCICIIDGDEKTQVDNIYFSGHNNGMKRVSEVFRGEDIYGEVTLKNIYRSQIARIAEKI